MDEFIGRIVANIGVDRTAVRKAVAIIPQFSSMQGLKEKVRTLVHGGTSADAVMPMWNPRRMCDAMSFVHEADGNMRLTRSLAQSPTSANCSDV
jgi:hypothetical protein